MELLEAIKNRRSIRQYRIKPVLETDLNTVLEAARLAPSWANTQCWRIVVIKDKKIKELLAETCFAGNRGITAIKQAPVLIVACAELGKSGSWHGQDQSDKSDKSEWFMFDTAMAIHNLTLAAYSLGLGTLHIGAFNAKKAARIIKVPKGIVVVELIPLGYPDGDVKPTSRKELSEIVFYEKYGQGRRPTSKNIPESNNPGSDKIDRRTVK